MSNPSICEVDQRQEDQLCKMFKARAGLLETLLQKAVDKDVCYEAQGEHC